MGNFYGTSGADTLQGGQGDDMLFGGDGADTLIGGLGSDSLFGGAGDDYLTSDSSSTNDKNILRGGNGSDTYFIGANAYRNQIQDRAQSGDTGQDRIVFEATTLADITKVVYKNGAATIHYTNALGEAAYISIEYNSYANDDVTSGLSIEAIEFADGTVISSGDLYLIREISKEDTIDLSLLNVNLSAADDVFAGDNYSDSIYAGDGNDDVSGQGGVDVLYGGAGDDTLAGDSGNDQLFGDAGEDQLYGGLGDDALDGGAGDDIVYGDDGNDALSGGQGYVVAVVDGVDTSVAGGNDTLFGGAGDDVLYGGNAVYIADQLGSGTIDDVPTIYAAGGDDSLSGGAGDDVLFGYDGNDRLDGGAGTDTLYGGHGVDTLQGDDGSDELFGGSGDDRIDGQNGDDHLYGGAGRDRLYGGDGDDLLSAGGNYAYDDHGLIVTNNSFEYLRGENGDDTYIITGQDTNLLILSEDASSGTNDTVAFANVTFDELDSVSILSSGDLRIRFINDFGEMSDIRVRDAQFVETFTFADGTSLSSAQMVAFANGNSNGFSQAGGNAADTLIGTGWSDTLDGAAGNDVLTGGDARDHIFGGAGNDTLNGGSGNDALFGGDGKDRLYGGDGDDTLIAGGNTDGGTEVLRGENGNDTYVITRADRTISIQQETTTSGDNDTVEFQDLTLTEVTDFEIIGDDVRIRFKDPAAGVNVFVVIQDGANIESYSFADGRTFTLSALQDAWTGTAFALPTLDVNGDFLDAVILDLPSVSLPALGTITQMDENGADTGQTYELDHSYHTPTEFTWVLDNQQFFGSAPAGAEVDAEAFQPGQQTSRGSDIVISSEFDDIIQNLNSGSDIFHGAGGNDFAGGNNGTDLLFGGTGDDHLDGENYADFLAGGDGDDRLIGGAGGDVLFGGNGNDTLFGGLSLDAMFGGAGSDVIVSRSDGGEPDELAYGAQIDDSVFVALTELDVSKDVVRLDDDGEPIEVSVALDVADSAGAPVNDALFGGAGADLFVFEFTLGATNDPSDIFATLPEGDVDRAVIDWTYVSGLNDSRHAHWMDGIGDDVIYDFEVGVDTIAFIGHTVDVWDVQYVDVDSNGIMDTVVTLRSNHVRYENGEEIQLSHHNDSLGSVTILNAVVDEDDIRGNVVDVPVHGDHGLHSDNSVIMAYLQSEYPDFVGMMLTDEQSSAMVNEFGSFATIHEFSSYYTSENSNLFEINSDNGGVAQNPIAIGTSGNDVIATPNSHGYVPGGGTIIAPISGGFIDGGDGDDIIIMSTDASYGLLGRDFINGGDGNDYINGGTQDDIIFGGDGDDVILGGGQQDARHGDEDIIFGGAGNDTINGGTQQDRIFGGAGDDLIISSSDLPGFTYAGEYHSNVYLFNGDQFDADTEAFSQQDQVLFHRDQRTTNDLLTGGAGSDTFEFNVLNGAVPTVANPTFSAPDANGIVHLSNANEYDLIHANFGVDTIYDFDASPGGDHLVINIHGVNATSTVAYEANFVFIDGAESTIINVTSNQTDDITTLFDISSGDEIIETAYAGEDGNGASVGEIILVGVSQAEFEAYVASGDLVFNSQTNALFAADHYADFAAFG